MVLGVPLTSSMIKIVRYLSFHKTAMKKSVGSKYGSTNFSLQEEGFTDGRITHDEVGFESLAVKLAKRHRNKQAPTETQHKCRKCSTAAFSLPNWLKQPRTS